MSITELGHHGSNALREIRHKTSLASTKPVRHPRVLARKKCQTNNCKFTYLLLDQMMIDFFHRFEVLIPIGVQQCGR